MREPQPTAREPQAMGKEPQSAIREPQAMGRKPQSAVREPQAMGREPQQIGIKTLTNVVFVFLKIYFIHKLLFMNK